MTEMNEKEILRTFEAIAEFRFSEETVERDLQAIHDTLTKGPDSVRPEPRKLWRTIMTNKYTQVSAVAAVLFLVMSLVFNLFSGSQLEAAEFLSRVAQNMDKMPWIKSTHQRYLKDQNEPASTRQSWMDMRNKRAYVVYDDDYIHLMDYGKSEWSIYRAETRDMIVKQLFGDWDSPGAEIQTIVERLETEGLEVTVTEGQANGQPVVTIEYMETYHDLGDEKVTKMMMAGQHVKYVKHKLVIRKKDLLPETREITYLNHDRDIIMVDRSQSEYIQTGPSDIYDLGVPRDVEITNHVPSDQVKSLRSQIDAHRSGFLDEYIAVITEAHVTDDRKGMIEALVVFCHGKKLRVEQYWMHVGRLEPLALRHQDQLAASLPYVNRFWPDQQGRDIRSIRLYDGLWQHLIDVKDARPMTREDYDRGVEVDKVFKVQETQRRPDGDLYGDDDIDDMAWRWLGWALQPEHMLEDAYSTENGFMAMELTMQAPKGCSRLPQRMRMYVDPNRDYICHRYIQEELFDAPWQEDKDWLSGVKNKDRLTERYDESEVTEYGRTSSGQWYPREIAVNTYDRHYGAEPRRDIRVIRIHLMEEYPEFPDGLFDPNSLPKGQ